MKNISTMKFQCDFCGKDQDHVELMIAGNNYAAICNRCVATCNEIILGRVKDSISLERINKVGD